MHFADRLIAAIKKKGSPICVGLDPRLSQIPKFICRGKPAAEAIIAFNKGIINAVYDLVPAVKPQFAFYLQHGAAGVRAFEETCAYARERGLIVIADAKCNDIGSTAEAYADAFLGKAMDCDALTVNPYLGWDGVKPFVEICKKSGKGIFVLVKTSNKSSGDFQDLETKDGMKNYEAVAHLLESWGSDEIGKSGYSAIGAVVGATFPYEAKLLRKIMPHTYFLVPGYGAQGGKAADVKVCFNADGFGALINSGRDIIFAWERGGSERNFGEAARAAVMKMKQELAILPA